MKFAIIETGGKQYKVSSGQKLKIEKIKKPGPPERPMPFSRAGEGILSFDKVLLVADGENIKIGSPYAEGAKVEAKILKEGRDRKKIVFRYHSKTRYRKKKGHRQSYTEVEIGKINL